MAELTKYDLCAILEVALLNFDGHELYKCLNYKLSSKHIMIAKEVLELIERRWK